MRPTEIQERSPQQRTGDFLYPMVTSKGASLIPASPLLNPKSKSTFPRSTRWEYIRDIAERTSPLAGPGRYKFNFSTNKGRGPKLLQSSFVESGQNANDFYVSGNLLCRKTESSSPVSASGSLPKINQTFSGLDRFMKSRIFLKDSSNNSSSKILSRSVLSRIGGESQRMTRNGSPRFDDSPIGVKEVLGKETESDSVTNLELSNLIKKVSTQIRQRGSETPSRRISLGLSARKPHIPLPEIHLNRSFGLTPKPLDNTVDWSPSEKAKGDFYLTGQNKALEMAKRRIRSKVQGNNKKKHNNSFSNGLYIRTPFDL